MISTVFKKFTDIIRGPSMMAENNEKEDYVLFLNQQRMQMITHIHEGKYCRDISESMILVDVPSFIMKYALLNVANLLRMNNEDLSKLQQIIYGLSMIVKYAVCLLEPVEKRRATWKLFPFNHNLIRTRITPLIGYDTILNQLGYVHPYNQGLSFVPGTEPNREIVANLIVDMMLFKTEIKVYLRGNHPLTEELNEFLPQQTVEEVRAHQVFLKNTNGTPDDLTSSDENLFEQENDTAVSTLMGEDDNDDVYVPVPSHQMLPNAAKVIYPPPVATNLVMPTPNRDDANTLPEVTMPYSNSNPNLNTSNQSSSTSLHINCDVCGGEAFVFCRKCSKKPLCRECNTSFHRHPNRKGHEVEEITHLSDVSLDSQPVAQVEGVYGVIAKNQSQAKRLNKSQETSLVKLPPNMQDNMQAYGLSKIDNIVESNLDQHEPIDNNNYQRGWYVQNGPYGPEYRYPTNSFNPNEAPSSHFLPHQALGMSHGRMGGFTDPSHLGATANGPIDAQLMYNANKMQMHQGQSTMPHTHGINLGGHQNGHQNYPAGDSPWPFQVAPGSSFQPIGVSNATHTMPYIPLQPSTSTASLNQDLHRRLSTSHPAHFSSPYSSPNVHTNFMATQSFRNNTSEMPMSSHFPNEFLNNTGGSVKPETYLPSGQLMHPLLSSQSYQSAGHLSMPSSNNLVYYRLHAINSVPDIHRRVELCEEIIGEIGRTVMELDKRMNEILLQDANPTENTILLHLQDRKSKFLKETVFIERYLRDINEKIESATAAQVQGVPSQSQVIFYPPPITSQKEGRTIDEHIPIKQTNKPTQKLEVNSVAAQVPPSPLANRKPTSKQRLGRQPVESSNDELPNRPHLHLWQDRTSPEQENILEKCFPPPSPSQLKEENNKHKWQCQHCTYINHPTAHACIMCDKTSDNPQLVEDDDHQPDLLDLLTGTFNQCIEKEEIPTKAKDKCHQCPTPSSCHQIIDYQEQKEQVLYEKKKAQEEFASCNSSVVDDLQTSSFVGSAVPMKSNSNLQGTQLPPPDLCQSSDASNSESPVISVGMNELGDGEIKQIPENAQTALAQMADRELNVQMTKDGRELLDLIKAVEFMGISVEAVEIAEMYCKGLTVEPLQWLKENWYKYLEKITIQVQQLGNAQEQNCVGELSSEEAEMIFINCHGNIKETIKSAVEKRIELFDYLSSKGNFPREEILRVMHTQKGNRSAAERELVQSVLHPIVGRVWDQRELDNPGSFGLRLFPQPEYYNSFSISIISDGDFQKAIKNKNIDKERRIRMILVEGKLKSWGRADLVIKILDEDLSDVEDLALEDVVEAVRNCQDRLGALAYLQQECLLCFGTFPMNKIRILNFCQCKMCQECLTKNFEIAIREKHIRNWVCPLCSLPDINDDELVWDYFQFLSMLLHPLVDKELMDLFEVRVRDLHLQKDPNFRWCAHCAVGFLAENPNQLRMTCFSCRKQTCYQCKRQWEMQHEELTCDQFAQWKIANDPDNQAVGLAKHLEENGIDCPSCKMRFALAKGGCMHFRCPECGHEFCSGCNEAYFNHGVCHKYKSCQNTGFHCHHPRDCFSYLRDNTVENLQALLEHCQVNFNVKTPEDQEDATLCPVMEQKESESVKTDENCGKESKEGQAGLCESHYKEYLTGLINGSRLDPLFIMSKDQMVALLKRHDLEVPPQGSKEKDADYNLRLSDVISVKLPLKRK